MTTIIFVPGGWHNAFHLRLVTPQLEKLGYNVVPVELKTNTKSDPPPVLQDNVAAILAEMKSQVKADHDFILVGHSVSGHSITLAANRFLQTAPEAEKAHFKHFVFIACFLDSARLAPRLWVEAPIGEDLWVEAPKDPHHRFYGDMSVEEAQPYADALISNRAQWPPEFGSEYKRILGTYVLCTNDRAMPPDLQKLEAQECGMQVVELQSDHVCPDLFLSFVLTSSVSIPEPSAGVC